MNQQGNVFLYVLVAVVLFAGLTYAITQTSQQTDAPSELDEGRTKVAANAILAWMGSAQNAITNLDQQGTDADELVFIRPSEAAFNTAPHIHKLFHPDGGGLLLKPIPRDAMGTTVSSPANGFYVGRFSNVEWTPTTATDVIAVAYGISQTTCAELNRKITGSTTIPTISIDAARAFVDTTYHSTGNVNFMIANCATCNERPALCVLSGGITPAYAYYNILVAR